MPISYQFLTVVLILLQRGSGSQAGDAGQEQGGSGWRCYCLQTGFRHLGSDRKRRHCMSIPSLPLLCILIFLRPCQIHSIHPKTFALTMLTRSGPHRDLPQELLTPKPSEPAQPPLSMEITSLSMLETGLLDTDGRMEKSRRPNGNAWKCFTVWRFRPGAEYNPYDSRGGRENHGTMFYLRGSFYHDSH